MLKNAIINKSFKPYSVMDDAIYTMQDIIRWLEECKARSKPEPMFGISIYESLQRLNDYYLLTEDCKSAILELSTILSMPNDALLVDMEKWAFQYEDLGANRLLMFKIDYFDTVGVDSEHLYLSKYQLFIDKNDFKYVIAFYDLFQILYWDRQDTSEDYYTSTPAKEPITQVREILQGIV